MFGWLPDSIVKLQWDFSIGISELAVAVLAFITWRIQRRQTEILEYHKKLARDQDDDLTYSRSVGILEHASIELLCIMDFKNRAAAPESQHYIARNWPLCEDKFDPESRKTIQAIINLYSEYIPAMMEVDREYNIQENNNKLIKYATAADKLIKNVSVLKPILPTRLKSPDE